MINWLKQKYNNRRKLSKRDFQVHYFVFSTMIIIVFVELMLKINLSFIMLIVLFGAGLFFDWKSYWAKDYEHY